MHTFTSHPDLSFCVNTNWRSIWLIFVECGKVSSTISCLELKIRWDFTKKGKWLPEVDARSFQLIQDRRHCFLKQHYTVLMCSVLTFHDAISMPLYSGERQKHSAHWGVANVFAVVWLAQKHWIGPFLPFWELFEKFLQQSVGTWECLSVLSIAILSNVKGFLLGILVLISEICNHEKSDSTRVFSLTLVSFSIKGYCRESPRSHFIISPLSISIGDFHSNMQGSHD